MRLSPRRLGSMFLLMGQHVTHVYLRLTSYHVLLSQIGVRTVQLTDGPKGEELQRLAWPKCPGSRKILLRSLERSRFHLRIHPKLLDTAAKGMQSASRNTRANVSAFERVDYACSDYQKCLANVLAQAVGVLPRIPNEIEHDVSKCNHCKYEVSPLV